jgi:hypothetical protein
MAEQQIVCATGIVVSTAISAGRIAVNHAEALVAPAHG